MITLRLLAAGRLLLTGTCQDVNSTVTDLGSRLLRADGEVAGDYDRGIDIDMLGRVDITTNPNLTWPTREECPRCRQRDRQAAADRVAALAAARRQRAMLLAAPLFPARDIILGDQ